MNSIEYWIQRYDSCADTFPALIKAIQQDARQSAFEEAAEVASLWLTKNRLHPDIDNERLNDSAKMAAHSALQQASLAILNHAAKEGK